MKLSYFQTESCFMQRYKCYKWRYFSFSTYLKKVWCFEMHIFLENFERKSFFLLRIKSSIICLETWKTHCFDFFLKKFRKCLESWKKIPKVLPKSEQKTIRHKFFRYRGTWPPYIPVFVGDFVPHIPHRSLCPQVLDERQSIETQVNCFSCISNVSVSGSISEF